MTGDDTLQEKAKQKAFRLLAVRARSEKELKSKLVEKGFDEAIVGKVAARLLELKYLDDRSFAGQWARNLGVNKLFGDRKIVSALREKGISLPLIEEAMTGLRNEISETEAMMKRVRKKVKSQSIAKMDVGDKRRLAASLMGKGFPPDLIFNMLNRSKEEFLNEGE
jgi:regulatory protein